MKKQRTTRKCPRCGSKDVLLQHTYDDGVCLYVCSDCDYDFETGGSHRRKDQDWRERDDELNDASDDYGWRR